MIQNILGIILFVVVLLYIFRGWSFIIFGVLLILYIIRVIADIYWWWQDKDN